VTVALTSLLNRPGGPAPYADPTARDLLAPHGGLLYRRGYVASYDTFNGGTFSGWADHFHYARPTMPLSLENRITFGGSSHSLRLAPAVRDIPAASGNGGGAFKRLDRPPHGNLVSFSGQLALRGDGSLTTEDWPFMSWGLAFDTQRWDNAARDFPQVTYQTRPNKADGTPQDPAWHVRVVRADGTTTSRVIPGTAGLGAGLNERKANSQYVRLTWELDRGDGHGRYYELQAGGRTFDLRNILGPGESASDHVLQDTSWDHFTGTLNLGLLLTRAPARTVDMLAGELVATYNDLGA